MTRPVQLAVAGAHMNGMPLNHQLVDRGGKLIRSCRTNPEYVLYALADTIPSKPGLVRRPGYHGSGIEVEVWTLPVEAFGEFVAELPEPMAIGNVTLEDGSVVKGFTCEIYAIEGSENITRFGGWRPYLRSKVV